MSSKKVVWRKRPSSEDLRGASRYLSLLFSPAQARKLLASYAHVAPSSFAAKDLLRASQLPLLPEDDPHVDSDLKRIRKDKALPPVLLVRGDTPAGVPVTIADGYHRVCAICYFDENEPVPCLLVNLP